MKYILGNKFFKTKKDILQYFKNYKDINSVGVVLQDDYKYVMIDLIKWHPEYENWKIKSDIEFRINLDFYNYKNYSYFNNGEWNVFSYIKCVKGGSIEKNHKFNLNKALRKAIEPFIFDFKKNSIHLNSKTNHFIYMCEMCNIMNNNVEIDHNFDIITFKDLMEGFLKKENRKYTEFNLVYENEFHLLNKEDEYKWITYHNKYAVLRCLCVFCHRNKRIKNITDFPSLKLLKENNVNI